MPTWRHCLPSENTISELSPDEDEVLQQAMQQLKVPTPREGFGAEEVL